jgi:probable rRNA maturation factor
VTRELIIRNRQRTRSVDLPLLRRITHHLLQNELELTSYQLGVHLVGTTEMAELNHDFLGHEGSTDVITFDHSDTTDGSLNGELFISVADGVAQARDFGTTWQSELTRYIVHGVLHLRGFDDLAPAPRRLMKREENRLVEALQEKFPLSKILKRSV